MGANTIAPRPAETRPLHWVRLAYVLLDRSAHMRGAALDIARAGTIGFASEALRRGHGVGIITFGETTTLALQASASLLSIRSALRGILAGGQACLAPAIERATAELRPFTGDRTILVILGGMPEDAEAAANAADRAALAGIRLTAIGTDDVSETFLDALAMATGWPLRVRPQELGRSIANAAHLLPMPPVKR